MNNLSYNISEINNNNNNNIENMNDFINEINKIHNIDNNTSNDNDNNDDKTKYDHLIANELNYFNNYNVKLLKHILNYYKINNRNMIKNEMVQAIVLFENEINNKEILDKRKKLWNNIQELNNDDYLSKFIIFP